MRYSDIYWTKMQHATISKILLSYSSLRKSVNLNKWGPNLWILHEWEYRCIGWSQIRQNKKKVLAWIRKPVGIWCDHHLPHARSTSLHRVDQAVDCGMLSHSSMAVWSCWILAGTGIRCRTRQSRASQTCLMGDMSVYAGHGRTRIFSASRNCVQILATWSCGLSCWNMRWWLRMNGTTMGLRVSSRHICAFKLPSIKNAIVFVIHSLCLAIA